MSEPRKRNWRVEIALGGTDYCYEAEQVSFEGGSLVLYNGDPFGQREVVVAFGPGGWTYLGHCKHDHDEDD